MDTMNIINANVARAILCVGLFVSLLIASVGVEARELFRYKDMEGNLVLSHTIPNESVRFGYDIVDEYGVLIRRVHPQLSQADYQRKLTRERKIQACEKVLNRVRKLYQTKSDIDYAETKGLESIDQSIANIRANLDVATKRRGEFEAQAAQLDLAGKVIPNTLLDSIERAKTQEGILESEVEQRFAEKLALRKTHGDERKVFALKDCEQGLPDLS